MPRYSSALNRWLRGDTVTPVASAARTTSSNSGWLSSESFSSLNLLLSVTVVTGTNPTLDVIVETASAAAGTNSRTVATFTQATAATTERKSAGGLDQFYRVAWTVGGTATPTFTFSVSGESK